MVSRKDANAQRKKRHIRVRAKISGTAARPRLCVYRSLNNIYVQIIDDTCGKTLVTASSVEKEFGKNGGNKEDAKKSTRKGYRRSSIRQRRLPLPR